jgi:hypothetical protein
LKNKPTNAGSNAFKGTAERLADDVMCHQALTVWGQDGGNLRHIAHAQTNKPRNGSRPLIYPCNTL